MSDGRVRAWREVVSIPTYPIGEPDPNPMFLEKRVYQGSSGAAYPLPVIDSIARDPVKQDWDAVFLENRYLKIMILPSLGGRVQMALDKTNDYHFVYYNRVIKPALVGLVGPWISGGIEFNWPQHHRPSTYLPVDCTIEEHADGAITVWCSEIDRMQRTKGMHGFRLYPEQSLLEINVKLYNRTDLPQTFLWWANPAVHVDENHQSIFPPDVHAVMDHGKRDVSSFPIATDEYYKVDYSPGTDISRYRNIPVPTSYMAYHSDFNFVGSYDHGRRAGLLHVANHHVAPGKKQWTWGNGDFGQRWDRHLTDEDGPYIELMCGVFTDNQPDFSWLMPGEEKAFTQVFMPYKGVGVVGNATREAAVGLEMSDGRATVRAYTSAVYPGATVRLTHQGDRLLDASFDADPAKFFEQSVNLPPGADARDVKVDVITSDGRTLVAYQPPQVDHDNIPDPAQAIGAPSCIDTVEQLYLAGQHLEQYRHATRLPEDYYREGLRRDPDDIRCNNALGLLLLRRGRFVDAEELLCRATQRLLKHNPNPYDGEPLYNLGLALEALGRFAEAEDKLWKAAWNAGWQAPAWFALARLACRRRAWTEALELVDFCLSRNTGHQRALHLRVHLLHRLGRAAEAATETEAALRSDPFNPGVLWEKALATSDWAPFDERVGGEARAYLELALDYASCGLNEEAISVLDRCCTAHHGVVESPLVHYYLAHFHRQTGDDAAAQEHGRRAAACAPQTCFPNRLEEIAILQDACTANPNDALARYLLGNLWYDRRQYEAAIACWEGAAKLNPGFPTTWRNLGLAYFNKRRDENAAWSAYQKALAAGPQDARVLFELDQLAKRLGHNPEERLARLDKHMKLVQQRDDLYLERVTLLNQLGRHDEALVFLLDHRFQPWEGGEGKVPAQFVLATTALARQAIAARRFKKALDLLATTDVWPESLGEGKLAGIQENNINFLRGLAHAGLNDSKAAADACRLASNGLSDPTSATFYNDQPPDMIFYQGLAKRALGEEDEAQARFRKLIEYGEAHLDDVVAIDYFAVSLPDFLVFEDDIQLRHRVHCHYMMALGNLGLERTEDASKLFDHVLELDRNHLGALTHQDWGAVTAAKRETLEQSLQPTD